jgi:hypothetical protein
MVKIHDRKFVSVDQKNAWAAKSASTLAHSQRRKPSTRLSHASVLCALTS